MRLNAYRGLTKTMQSGIPGPGGLARQVAVGRHQPGDRRAGARHRGRLRAAQPRRRARSRQRRLAVRLPALPRQLDRGRHHRHPQEHHRRARARPAEDALGLPLMYFDLTDEQQAIKATAKDFLAARYKSERIRELADSEAGFEQSDWDEMAELGWPGLALPEEWGGQGLGIVDLAVLFEEMGYALAPSPLLLEHDRRPRALALRLRRPARALPAAARRGRAARRPGALGRRLAGDARRLHDGGRGRRRRRRPRRRKGPRPRCRRRRLLPSSPPPTAAATWSRRAPTG